jgi:signal transduction histidine kinase
MSEAPSGGSPPPTYRDRFSGRFGSRTLAGRLALGGIAWIGLWASALLLVFNLLLSSVLAGQVDAALRARSEAIAATVVIRDGQPVIRPNSDDAALYAGASIYAGDTLLEGTALSAGLRARLVQRGERSADREVLGPVRYLAVPITSKGHQVGTIVVSSDLGARSRTEQVVRAALFVLIVMTLIFTFFALRATVGRALRPVRAMGDQAAAWSDRDIDRRFDPHAGPLELRQLAVTLNALLERIAATLRHERSFTAELSHELRTPLAHLHAEVDVLAAGAADPVDPDPVTAQDLDDLRTSIRRLESLVESALVPARVQHGAAGLTEIADLLAGVLPPPSVAAALLVTGRTELTLAVDGDIARRALLPVLENAWRYALREVRIDVQAAAGTAAIVVSDDGGRLDPADAERIFEPGFRAEGSDGYPGAGLGLALTRRICRAAGGDATADVTGGRTAVTLTFPCLER